MLKKPINQLAKYPQLQIKSPTKSTITKSTALDLRATRSTNQLSYLHENKALTHTKDLIAYQKTQIQRLSNELTQLKNRNYDIYLKEYEERDQKNKAEIGRLSVTLRSLIVSCQNYRKQVDPAMKEIRYLEEINRELMKENKELQKHHQNEKNITHKKQQKDQGPKNVKSSQLEVNELKKSYQELNKIHRHCQQQIIRLNNQIKQKDQIQAANSLKNSFIIDKFRQLQTAYHSKHTVKQQQLEGKLNLTLSELQQKRKMIINLKRQIGQLTTSGKYQKNEEKNKLEAELIRTRSERDLKLQQMTGNLQNQKNKQNKVKALLQSKQSENNELKKRIKQLDRDNFKLSEKIKMLQSEVSVLGYQLQKYKKRQKDCESDTHVKHIKKGLKIASNDSNIKQTVITELQQQLQKQKSKNNELQDIVKRIEATLKQSHHLKRETDSKQNSGQSTERQSEPGIEQSKNNLIIKLDVLQKQVEKQIQENTNLRQFIQSFYTTQQQIIKLSSNIKIYVVSHTFLLQLIRKTKKVQFTSQHLNVNYIRTQIIKQIQKIIINSKKLKQQHRTLLKIHEKTVQENIVLEKTINQLKTKWGYKHATVEWMQKQQQKMKQQLKLQEELIEAQQNQKQKIKLKLYRIEDQINSNFKDKRIANSQQLISQIKQNQKDKAEVNDQYQQMLQLQIAILKQQQKLSEIQKNQLKPENRDNLERLYIQSKIQKQKLIPQQLEGSLLQQKYEETITKMQEQIKRLQNIISEMKERQNLQQQLKAKIDQLYGQNNGVNQRNRVLEAELQESWKKRKQINQKLVQCQAKIAHYQQQNVVFQRSVIELRNVLANMREILACKDMCCDFEAILKNLEDSKLQLLPQRESLAQKLKNILIF